MAELSVSGLVGIIFASAFMAGLCSFFLGYAIVNLLTAAGKLAFPTKPEHTPDAAG